MKVVIDANLSVRFPMRQQKKILSYKRKEEGSGKKKTLNHFTQDSKTSVANTFTQ